MNVLVVNAGSSSLKYQFFDTAKDTVIAKGLCDRIGIDGKITHKQLVTGKVHEEEVAMPNHTAAIKLVVDCLINPEYGCVSSMDEIEAVGHRIVHGGPYFTESVLLTEEVLNTLSLCHEFAPLHTPAHIQGIKGCLNAMPTTPQVLVFDTSFHTTIPAKGNVYGIPYEMTEKYQIRRYGAHGTSHRYVSQEAIKLLDKPVEDTKIVTCHLGNGSSISAVKGGKCVDTSMGFTPLAGVIMGTRTGDMDPAVVTYIMGKEGFTPSEMSEFMNKKGGLLGISGVSSDCRDIDAAIEAGNERAKLAIDILEYQIKKLIGGYAAAMNGLDAVVFTAGIGENNTSLRSDVMKDMDYLGIELDEAANAAKETVISSENSKVKVFLIPTNEELVIAKDTEAIVSAL